MTKLSLPSILATCILTGAFTLASACPDGYYDTPIGMCLPNSGTVVDTVRQPIVEVLTQLGGPALEQWIIQSRNTAISSSQPVPLQIRAQLSAYYSQDILNRARYKVGDSGFLNAARTIMNNPDVAAVTLIDVIVFRSAGDIMTNLPLWAHELKHVQQFAEWGTREFALRYTRDNGGVENMAYAIENQVRANLTAQSRPQPPGPPPGFGTGPFSVATGVPVRFCRTPMGNCAIPPAMVPMGTPCYCASPSGPIPGQAF
jgi:hypothetical protein